MKGEQEPSKLSRRGREINLRKVPKGNRPTVRLFAIVPCQHLFHNHTFSPLTTSSLLRYPSRHTDCSFAAGHLPSLNSDPINPLENTSAAYLRKRLSKCRQNTHTRTLPSITPRRTSSWSSTTSSTMPPSSLTSIRKYSPTLRQPFSCASDLY